MSLITADRTGAKGAGKIIAKLSSSAAFTTTKGDGNSLHLGPSLQGVGMVSLYSYSIGAASWIGAESACLDGEHSIFLTLVAAERMHLVGKQVVVLGAVDADDLQAISRVYVSSWRSVAACAVTSSAESRADGSVLPLASARRMIPAQAFALKKYLGGMEPCSSTCDNEHTAASLGQSEVLGVKNSPSDSSLWSKDSTRVRPSLPWWLQLFVFTGKRSKKASECVVFAAEYPRDVFPDDDALLFMFFFSPRIYCVSQLHELKSELASMVFKPFARSCD